MSVKAKDIKAFIFEITDEEDDDGDALYEGKLTIQLASGVETSVNLHWVRSGDLRDFNSGNVEALIQYLADNDIDL